MLRSCQIAAVCIEQCHDKNGICWPKKLPLILIFEAEGDGFHKETAMKIYKNLKDTIKVLYDDRPDRFGKKLRTKSSWNPN